MDQDKSGKKLLAYAICAEDWRHFAEGFEEISDAPAVCPVCGNPLYTACPRCGMLYRTGTGICSNCGEPLRSAPRQAHRTPRRE